MNFRIGQGTDVHRLVSGRRLIIGGIEIESELGADGHSDADVLFHAITDALLGAIAVGDIGSYFPSSEERWRNAESSVFLKYALGLVRERGGQIMNIDSTIHLERPKLRPYIDRIRGSVAAVLGIELDQVSVKAKTGEAVDAVGEMHAIRADAAVLLQTV